MINGISHITLTVKDLERTARLFEKVFGAEEIYSSGADTFSLTPEKFFLIGGVWICIMENEAPSERTYGHVAFSVPEEELDSLEDRIQEAGAELRPGRSRVEGEGRSVYFYDFDNHLFELHAGSLEDRLRRYGRGK